MDTANLPQIYKELGDLIMAGKGEDARAFLSAKLEHMPENMRDELLFELFIDGMKKEAEGREVITDLREEGVTAAESLFDLKEEVERESE